MKYYRHVLAVGAVVIFYTAIDSYSYSFTLNSNALRANWIIGFVLASLPLLIEGVSILKNLKSPLIVWCVGYMWVTGAWFLYSSQSDVAWQEVRWRVLSIFQLVMFLLIFSDRDTIRLARQALAGGVLLGIALNLYELFVPLSFSLVFGRSAGMYQNPNLAGEAMVMGMVCSVTILPSRFRVLFLLATGVGVFVTFSRAAILAWTIAVIGLMLDGIIRVKEALLYVFIAVVLTVVALIPLNDQLQKALDNAGTLDKNVEQRLDWLTDPTGVSDYSSWQRVYLAKQAWDRIADHPLVGSGTGSSREAAMYGVENQILVFMEDHGFLGATILPLLIMAVIWGASGETRPLAKAFGFSVLILSCFTHTILYQSYSLLVFSLMAGMALTSREVVETAREFRTV